MVSCSSISTAIFQQETEHLSLGILQSKRRIPVFFAVSGGTGFSGGKQMAAPSVQFLQGTQVGTSSIFLKLLNWDI